MKPRDYQAQAIKTSTYGKAGDLGTADAPLMGLTHAAGTALNVYKRFLRDDIKLYACDALLKRELGHLLWYVSMVASICGIELESVMEASLVREPKYGGKKPSQPAVEAALATLTAYQSTAMGMSSYGKRGNPSSAIPPLMGLSNAVGSVCNVYKNHLCSGKPDLDESAMKKELGDLLWYVAVVAATLGFEIREIADYNLNWTRERYEDADPTKLPVLDQKAKPTEQFPRRLVIEFEQYERDGKTFAKMMLVEAIPNAFPDGPIPHPIDTSKMLGFQVGAGLGDPLRDNSRKADDYRFHDAIHLGFMAVLGWSPTMRALLRIKRKSDDPTDDGDDGARANFLEEGLAAILFRMSETRGEFQKMNSVSSDVLDLVQPLVRGLEVADFPMNVWRPAIAQGFVAFKQLADNRGGVLIADLDQRSLEYTKVYRKPSGKVAKPAVTGPAAEVKK